MDDFTHFAIRQQEVDEAGRRARHHVPTSTPPQPVRRRAARRLRRLADALES